MEEIVYSVIATPKTSLVFAGKASGLYVSRDKGETWEDAYAGLDLPDQLPTMALAYRQNPDSNQVHVFAGVPGGVLSSSDGGRSWQVGRLPEPPPLVSYLAVSPDFLQDGVVLAGTVEDGVFRSVDGGRSWSRWNFGLLDMNVFALAISPRFAQDETLFAGTETGIFRSANGGRAWREVNFPMDLAPVLSLAISPRFEQDGLLCAGTEACGLFLSRDGGKTWRSAGECFSQATVNAILIDGNTPGALHILALANDRLLVSRDGGDSWSEWSTQAPDGVGISCVAAPDGLAEGAALLVGMVDGRVLWI